MELNIGDHVTWTEIKFLPHDGRRFRTRVGIIQAKNGRHVQVRTYPGRPQTITIDCARLRREGEQTELTQMFMALADAAERSKA